MSDELVSRLLEHHEAMRGPDYYQAAQALSEARAEIERLKDGANFILERGRVAHARALAAESELSTLRDVLVLCGELGGMGKDETPADYLRRLIDEVAGVEPLRARVREVVGLGLDVISEERGWGTYPRMEGSEIYTDADVFSRAARQLMEEVK